MKRIPSLSVDYARKESDLVVPQGTLVDLFAGCGGMSLGMEMAGFSTLVAVEKDDWASQTFKLNHPDATVITGDIVEIGSDVILGEIGNSTGLLGVVGGPPCQGFSLSGNRDPKDPRNSLFIEFMRVIKDLSPDFFVMENVPGLLSMKTKDGRWVKDIILETAQVAGYKSSYFELDSAYYGVPQRRRRIFFVGLKNQYPYYKPYLVPAPTCDEDNWVSVADAIMDLPVLKAGEGCDDMDYDKDPTCDYQRLMRDGSTAVSSHVAMRHTKRLVDRFSVIKHGQSVKDVPWEHSALRRGNPKEKSGKVFSQNNMRVFPNRPSPTLAASFQSNFIHPYSDRNFTAREGARIQSFPDSYRFFGKRTTMSWEKSLSQYQQIGNAVPPLLAKALGGQILRYFEGLDLLRRK